MQETKTRTPAEDMPPSRPGWIRAVAIIGVGALLIGTLYGAWQAVASSNDPDPIGQGSSEPDFSLTDEQAIARFKELESLQIAAYENVDLTAVSDFAGPGPFKDKVVQELRQLRRDDVFAVLSMKNQQLRVTQNTQSQIAIEETVTLNIEFHDVNGGDATTDGKPQRLVVDWRMESFENGWLITKSTAIDTIELP